MAQRARIRGLLTLTNSRTDNKRMELLNRDFQGAINIRRCAVLKTRPEDLTQSIFLRGQPFRVEVYKEKLRPIAEGRSRKARRRVQVGSYVYPPWLGSFFLLQ